MTDEKKIYLMTQLAIFERHHREQLHGVQTYFRSDYIGRTMIKNGFRITLAFFLILAGWGLYNVETLIVDITQIDAIQLGAKILFLYAAVLSSFLVLTYAIQTVRYNRARHDLQTYREMLKKLEKTYQKKG